MHSLLDIKYSLVILENATFVNAENQSSILQSGCNIIDTLLKLIVVCRNIVASKVTESSSDNINMLDAATDCMTGSLKLLLNLTYNHTDACDRVRLACIHENWISTLSNTSKANHSASNNGLAIILSLLNLQFTEKEQFDIRQHVLGLLINLVEINSQNRSAIGLIDGAISKIVDMYVECIYQEEQHPNDQAGSTDPTNAGLVGTAYYAMLLGWLAHDSVSNTTTIRCSLPPSRPLSSLAQILKLFLSFQLQTGILPEDVHKSLITVIKSLENQPQ